MITLNPALSTPIVQQIFNEIQTKITQGDWVPKSKLPSIRRLAQELHVSFLTVSNAYNRLVAEGLIEAHKGSGFYVTYRDNNSPIVLPQQPLPYPSIDALWMLQSAFEINPHVIQAGSGWLNKDYLFSSSIKNAFSNLSRRQDTSILEYGNPYGYKALRESIRHILHQQNIDCDISSIILTHGASQALELSIRSLTQPGDHVLVEDPGYCNLFPLLTTLHLSAHAVPRLKDGPDLEHLEKLIATQNPKAFIINTRLQNPTGTNCSRSTIQQLLRLAERYNLTLIEDDIFGGLSDNTTPTLSSFGGLKHVIYIGSFSKTIAPGLRVGFMACSPQHVQRIVHLKMSYNLTSSNINEAIVQYILSEGRYRLHIQKIKEKLSVVREKTAQELKKNGLELFTYPAGGMFLWAKFSNKNIDPLEITKTASKKNIMLAPGCFFRPNQANSPWMRFNITQMNHAGVYHFLNTCS
ncbi:aminotransferase-like domain-containing protein [Swingsia samuiensis]|uniref:PLP-dependent aminotransferase family protein n=1 Tax=Swingsia samuiensis TaxID=1293412 RepID=A0A4Y6UJ35_9PROT|nr:PLP-dependent aminotransferase family protein [Swingsia samuiensis]QDH16638.1 PLP-dependent aminotransferase family protein [Swingsia samuiensis]